MRRKLFTLCSFVSLLLCVAFAVAGGLGFRAGGIEYEWARQRRAVVFVSDQGLLAVVLSSGWPSPDWLQDRGRVTEVGLSQQKYNAVVVEFIRETARVTGPRGSAVVTWYDLRTNALYGVLLTAILPVMWAAAQYANWQRDRIGRCPTCGYDLRASPERCPECGSVAGSTETAA